jgi:hypothetical protein
MFWGRLGVRGKWDGHGSKSWRECGVVVGACSEKKEEKVQSKGLLVVSVLWMVAVALVACGKPPAGKGGMPIYVTPYYDSEGLKINVGKFSWALAATDGAAIRKTAAEMKAEWETLTAEAMFVLAIRLYDLGLKDEAVYWFYSAQYRAMLFTRLLDPAVVGSLGSPPFELKQAYGSFHQLAGEYINGYAFGDPEKLARTVAAVQTEGKKLPPLKTIYPGVIFLDEARWGGINSDLNSGMDSMLDMLKNSATEIKAQRKASGIEGRY